VHGVRGAKPRGPPPPCRVVGVSSGGVRSPVENIWRFGASRLYRVLGAALAVVGSVMSNDLAARRALVRETRTTIYRDLLPRLYAGDNPSWNTPPRPRRVSPNARVPVGELEVLQGVLPRADRRYGERLRILLDDAEETAREPERRQDELDRRTASFIAVADEFAAYLAERLRGPWWR
jgi:hypothetical protein